jgi:predicted O-methyltransferase YrrM
MEIPSFEGGWSYTQREMTELFKNITYSKNYSILEFGSGNSTLKIYDFVKKQVDNLTLYSYESNCNYLQSHNEIKFILYDEDDIPNTPIPDMKFDLILIDGPNGYKRSLWYSKIRNNVKPGTVLLVDDFNHYQCFSDELDKNFKYEILSFHDEPFVAYGEHSWKIVNILEPIY